MNTPFKEHPIVKAQQRKKLNNEMCIYTRP